MKFKMALLSAAMLLCLVGLVHPVLAGSGCGSNWLGSDTSDPDFWVSKNQNQGITSPSTNVPAAANNAKPAIQSLTPDMPSPQTSGAVIIWTADATAPQKDLILYNFLLKGPSTEGLAIEKTGWTSNNTWTWNTSEADIGNNQIEVRVKYGQNIGTDAFDASKTADYVIAAPGEQQDKAAIVPVDSATVDINPHPKLTRTTGVEKTETKTKPRIAPDERPRAYPVPGKVNMSMPDPSPKPLVPENEVAESTAEAAEFPAEVYEPEIPDVGGKWTVSLVGGEASSLDLIFIQNGDMVMGSGSLNDMQGKIPVTASGSISGDRLKLDVKTVVSEFGNKIDKRFKITLDIAVRELLGSYNEYNGETFVSKGNATASKPGFA